MLIYFGKLSTTLIQPTVQPTIQPTIEPTIQPTIHHDSITNKNLTYLLLQIEPQDE